MLDYIVSAHRNDKLEFYINDELQATYTGRTDPFLEQRFRTVQFFLEQGNNTLRWSYIKDGNTIDGDDAAFLRDIEVTDADTIPITIEIDDTRFSTPIVQVPNYVGFFNERPNREVTLSNDFKMGIYEVSNADYVRMLNWALDPNEDGNSSDAIIEANPLFYDG